MSELIDMMRNKADDLKNTILKLESTTDQDEYDELREELDQSMLDVKVVSDLGHDAYIGAYITLTTGGPHIVLNTWTQMIEGHWGTESALEGASDVVCNYFDEIIAEAWHAMRN